MGWQTPSNEAVFNWSIPFSLEGVSVLGFEIQVYIVNSITGDVVILSNATVSESSYVVPHPPTVSCAIINITIQAINYVGLGQPAFSSFMFIEGKRIQGLC